MRGSLRRMILTLAACAVALPACDRSPTAPDAVALQAVELNGDPRTGGSRSEQPNVLQQLLQQAFRQALEEGGAEAVRALRAQLAPFEEALRAAVQSGDRQAVRRAQAALQAAQIDIVVRVLGAAAPRSVLEAADRLLADAAAKIQAAKAAGRDVERLEARLRQVRQLYADAVTALQAGNLATSLQLALQALDGARSLHRVLG